MEGCRMPLLPPTMTVQQQLLVLASTCPYSPWQSRYLPRALGSGAFVQGRAGAGDRCGPRACAPTAWTAACSPRAQSQRPSAGPKRGPSLPRSCSSPPPVEGAAGAAGAGPPLLSLPQYCRCPGTPAAPDLPIGRAPVQRAAAKTKPSAALKRLQTSILAFSSLNGTPAQAGRRQQHPFSCTHVSACIHNHGPPAIPLISNSYTFAFPNCWPASFLASLLASLLPPSLPPSLSF